MEYKQLSIAVKDDVVLGENVTIVQPSNLYGCKLGDNCFVGPFVEIQKDVIIGLSLIHISEPTRPY